MAKLADGEKNPSSAEGRGGFLLDRPLLEGCDGWGGSGEAVPSVLADRLGEGQFLQLPGEFFAKEKAWGLVDKCIFVHLIHPLKLVPQTDL